MADPAQAHMSMSSRLQAAVVWCKTIERLSQLAKLPAPADWLALLPVLHRNMHSSREGCLKQPCGLLQDKLLQNQTSGQGQCSQIAAKQSLQ